MTTLSYDLARRIANVLEREHRHLSDEPSEGHSVHGIEKVDLTAKRMRRAKKSYNARFLNRLVRSRDYEGFHLIRGKDVEPQMGDFVLARVVSIGQHKRLESQNSRRRSLFAGDEIIVAYGDRYAPDQFLAEVPRNLNYTNLVAAGGVAARVIEKHTAINPATVIEPLGLICDDEGVLTTHRVSPEKVRPWQEAATQMQAMDNKPQVIVVFGSSMNSGKSTTVGCLINGLSAAGFTVHSGKATGTGAGNDAGLFNDAGADRVVDFTDYGYPTTYKLDFEQVKSIFFTMVADLAADNPDYVIIEIADGIYQGETNALINDADFHGLVDSVLFACGEALSAAAGVKLLQEANMPLVAVSGVLTRAPLIVQEARAVIDVDIIPTYDLCLPDVVQDVVGAK
ncbi:Uncharacterised protein [Trueperella bialowiezensis]|uniref:DUF1611 domain-containing protein n=2 Tax=Trueperella bialowiezensis TaxID=312285 RepID=A0A3S4Z6A2_9ACTO|nr:Uncharacterised protein [Trueperella bialowiezensis]